MFETFLDYIARTNLFNFIIFAGIIVFIFVKLDVLGGLDKGAKIVSDKIDDSKNAKETSESNLQSIENKLSSLQDEVNQIIDKSEKNAEIVGEQIISEANKSTENIKANTLKLINNKTEVLKNDIMRRASIASVEVAKEQIINELSNNYDLHNKLIDESIEAINGVNL